MYSPFSRLHSFSEGEEKVRRERGKKEVMVGQYLGLGLFLLYYSPLVNMCKKMHYNCIQIKVWE